MPVICKDYLRRKSATVEKQITAITLVSRSANFRETVSACKSNLLL